MEQDLKAKIDHACRTAEDFTKLYYESLDKRRYLISRMYMDTATLIWNGNGVTGKETIQKFWTDLPPSEHTVHTLDAQPITGPEVANQLTFLVKIGGQVKYDEKNSKSFNQTFLITAIGDKWKICIITTYSTSEQIIYTPVRKSKEIRLNMTRTRIFIREVNNMRLPLKMQSRTRSIRNYPTGYNEIVDMSNNLQHVRPTEDIPGPKALPLIGNLFRFLPYIGEYYNVNVLTFMRMLHNKYGNIVKFDGLKKQPSIFLFCPELCKNMYQLQGKIPMRIAMEPLHNYRKSRKDIYKGQYGLTTSQGESWKDFRSKVGPHMMRPNIVKMHATQIHDITSEFVDKMSTLRDPKTLELPDDFMNELYKWSVETMCLIALNYRMGCLKSNLALDSEPQIMINCVKEMFNLTYRIENVPSLLKISHTRNYQKLFRALDQINVISAKYIEYAKNNISKSRDNTNRDYSILEKLLCIDKQVALVMALDILMSTDTTSNAAGALLYYIANNKEKQDKLREEVMSVLPDKTTPITHDLLEKIPYVRGCIKECMRLFPIANGILRNMPKDVSLGGYLIPKGANVMACHAVLSMDPKYFARPMEYIPERWIRDSPEFLLYRSTHTHAYMPFGYGVRACIGQRFAEMELEMLLLKVIRNFRIEWHYGPLEHESQIVNTVKSPLRFKLIDL